MKVQNGKDLLCSHIGCEEDQLSISDLYIADAIDTHVNEEKLKLLEYLWKTKGHENVYLAIADMSAELTNRETTL